MLVKEGFIVLPYTNDDLIVARKLIDAGAAAVMPLGAPIGSGMGIQNLANLRILRERITEVPLIVDAGVGTASDAAIAMELGADGVLMNTAIAGAQDAVLMAEAMRAAVEAGRKAFLAGRIEQETLCHGFEPAGRGRKVKMLNAFLLFWQRIRRYYWNESARHVRRTHAGLLWFRCRDHLALILGQWLGERRARSLRARSQRK